MKPVRAPFLCSLTFLPLASYGQVTEEAPLEASPDQPPPLPLPELPVSPADSDLPELPTPQTTPDPLPQAPNTPLQPLLPGAGVPLAPLPPPASILNPTPPGTGDLFETESTPVNPELDPLAAGLLSADTLDPAIFTPTPEPRNLPEVIDNLSAVPFDGEFRGDEAEGFAYALRLTSSYSSNLALGGQSDASSLSTRLVPSVAWSSAPKGGARYVASLSYSPTAVFYHSGPFSDTLDHAFAGSLSYEASKSAATLSFDHETAEQPNRILGDLAETSSSGLRLNLSHLYSDKTSLNASASYSKREQSSGDGRDTDTIGASIGSRWQASPLVSVGPSLRYASSDGELFSSESLALLLDASYAQESGLSINGSLGIETVRRDGLGNQVNPTGSVRVNYQINSSWTTFARANYESISLENQAFRPSRIATPGNNPALGAGAAADGDPQLNFSAGLIYDAGAGLSSSLTFDRQTSPGLTQGTGSLVDNSVSFNLTKMFMKSSLSLNLAAGTTEFDGDTFAASLTDDRFRQISLSYSYPELFKNTLLSAQLSFLTNKGRRDYDQTSASISLSYRF